MNLYSAISQSISLGALVSRKQDRLQCAPKDTVAYNRFTQFDRQWIPDGQTQTPDREAPSTDCAKSIPRNDQAVHVSWSSMSTGNVGDWSAAVDRGALFSRHRQPACTPRVQERWASGVGPEPALTDRGRTCERLWRGEPPHSGRVVKVPIAFWGAIM